ncbi:MAG: hypothetical protein JOZ55_11905 [Alphaproteobacteria bacterium]|nr:hypothetical protein [Alphaproteobacteria bacterium]
MSNASLPSQQVRVGTLATIADAAEQTDAPCLIVVGDNVSLQSRMDWLKLLEAGTTAAGAVGKKGQRSRA